MTADIATLARAANIELPAGKPRKIDSAAEQKHLDAIAKAPDPTKAREAYAKFLADHGDPLGTLAVVGHARVAMQEREKKLFAKHAGALVGPLTPWIENKWIDATWERGFIRAVELRIEKTLGVSEREIVRTLLDHPSARLLQDVRISANHDGDYRDDYQPLIDVFVDRRKPLALREFAVSGAFGNACGDVSRIWEAFPQLTGFWAFGSAITLGEIDAPSLKDVRITLMTLDDEALAAIANMRAPKLESLVLGGLEATQADTLAPVLDGKAFPALKTLCFDGVLKADKLTDAVLKSPLAKRLTQFSMWNSKLSKDAKARVLKRFPKAFTE